MVSPAVEAEYREMTADKHLLCYADFFLKYSEHVEMLKHDPINPYRFPLSGDSEVDSDDSCAEPNICLDTREIPFYIVCNECKLDHTIRVLTQRIETLEYLLDGNNAAMESPKKDSGDN